MKLKLVLKLFGFERKAPNHVAHSDESYFQERANECADAIEKLEQDVAKVDSLVSQLEQKENEKSVKSNPILEAFGMGAESRRLRLLQAKVAVTNSEVQRLDQALAVEEKRIDRLSNAYFCNPCVDYYNTKATLDKIKPRLKKSTEFFDAQRTAHLASKPMPPSSEETLNNPFNTYNGF
jgi:hypothetical protein